MMSLNLKGIRDFADIPIECNSHHHNKTVTMGIVNHGDETMNNLISHTSLFDPIFIESILPQYPNIHTHHPRCTKPRYYQKHVNTVNPLA